MSSDESKRCSTCHEALPLDAFAVRRASTDGRQNACRSCSAAYARRTRNRKLEAAPSVAPDRKWCRRCHQVKCRDAFSAHRSTYDRLQTYCRECFAQIYRRRREWAGQVTRPSTIPTGHKFCRGCKRIKPFSEWSPRPRATDGYHFRCRECISRRDRERHLAATYGLSPDDLTELLALQDGRCAICLTAEAIHIDHDHADGRIRGILCFRCNAALGQLRDDPEVMRRAADYLEGRVMRMRRIHPSVVQIVYPSPPEASDPPARFGPARPPLDIAELRRLAMQG